MLFAVKNDNGIELHLSADERELLYNALRHYSAYGRNDTYILAECNYVAQVGETKYESLAEAIANRFPFAMYF